MSNIDAVSISYPGYVSLNDVATTEFPMDGLSGYITEGNGVVIDDYLTITNTVGDGITDGPWEFLSNISGTDNGITVFKCGEDNVFLGGSGGVETPNTTPPISPALSIATLSLSVGKTATFDLHVGYSTEATYDLMNVKLNGGSVGSYSGHTGVSGTPYVTAVLSGTSFNSSDTFIIEYDKDTSWYAGVDTVYFYIKNLQITDTTVIPPKDIMSSEIPSWMVTRDNGGAHIGVGVLTYNKSIATSKNCTMNLGAGTMTVTVPGRYYVRFHGGGGVATTHQIYMRVNGVKKIRGYSANPTGSFGPNLHMQALLDLAINDYVDIYVATGTLVSAGNDLLFSGYMIGGGSDVTPPTVLYVSPDVLEIDVLVDSVIYVRFSEKMDPATITTSTITCANGGSVVGVVNYDIYSMIATFTPSENLSPSTLYVTTVVSGASGVKDLAGNQLSADYVWPFTTEIFPAPPKPPIINNAMDLLTSELPYTLEATPPTERTDSTFISPSEIVSYTWYRVSDTGFNDANFGPTALPEWLLTGLPVDTYHFRIICTDTYGTSSELSPVETIIIT